MENNAGSYNILEDDKYADVFIDLEGNKTEPSQSTEQTPGEFVLHDHDSDVNSVQMSMSDIYKNKDDRFINKLQIELEQIKQNEQSDNHNSLSNRNSYNFGSHSPLSMSVDSQSVNSDSENSDLPSHKMSHAKFRKLTYEDVESSLNKNYTKELRLASELDILLTYLKGQKHIYKLSNQLTLQKFHAMMFPAIFITGSITLVGPFFERFNWSGWLLSSLNALLTVLIAVNNFMKWQATAELFHNIAFQFDNLAISVEMTRNQWFVDDVNERSRLTYEKMKETEKRIMDIKYNNQNLIIPYEVQIHNPIITHINIFSFIKKIEHHKKNLILKYKDIKNEIRYIMFKWERDSQSMETKLDFRKQTEVKRLEHLMKEKETLKEEILQNNSNHVYAYIDTLFTVEMQRSEEYYSFHSAGMYLLRPIPPFPELKGNTVVDNYLNFIFDQRRSQKRKCCPLLGC
jgi:hypothetical protein